MSRWRFTLLFVVVVLVLIGLCAYSVNAFDQQDVIVLNVALKKRPAGLVPDNAVTISSKGKKVIRLFLTSSEYRRCFAGGPILMTFEEIQRRCLEFEPKYIVLDLGKGIGQ